MSCGVRSLSNASAKLEDLAANLAWNYRERDAHRERTAARSDLLSFEPPAAVVGRTKTAPEPGLIESVRALTPEEQQRFWAAFIERATGPES
jgi:hypothetical protein